MERKCCNCRYLELDLGEIPCSSCGKERANWKNNNIERMKLGRAIIIAQNLIDLLRTEMNFNEEIMFQKNIKETTGMTDDEFKEIETFLN